MLINKAAAISGQISPHQISFEESISSDHAALLLLWYPAESIAIAPPPELSSYAIDELLKASWVKLFGPLPSPNITDVDSLNLAAQCLHEDIDYASAQVFSKQCSPDPCGVRWWNQDCAVALTTVYHSYGQPRKEAIHKLHHVIASVK